MTEPKRGDYYLRLPDGSGWPDPTDPNEVEWRIRNLPSERADAALTAASYMTAYREIINLTCREREAVVRKIKAALKAKEKKP